MSDGSLHPLEGLTDRVRALGETSTRLTTLRDRLATELASKEMEVSSLTEQAKKLTMVGELFRALMDILVVKQVRTVESVVTSGINSIFHDLGLAFDAEVAVKYNKIAVDFFFRQGSAEDPLAIRGKPLEAFGGGPSAVADLILRMLSMLRLKKKPIMLLDETLSAVSDEYVDATGKFLKELADEMGVDVILVTHKQSFLDHVDRGYRCTEVVNADGSRRLELKVA